MADNFKELLDEQRKTNQLLVDSMKDPSLTSSIKQNLGEILNASRLAGQSEKFQKKEGITEVDEAQKKTTETIAKSSVIQAEQSQGTIYQLVKVQEETNVRLEEAYKINGSQRCTWCRKWWTRIIYRQRKNRIR